MPTQLSSKSDIITGIDMDNDGLEMDERGKNAGTDADAQEMRMLGKTQQLNVRVRPRERGPTDD